MVTQYSKKLRVVFAGAMLALALNSTPATAHSNNHGYVAPLAAFVAFSWLSHHNHSRHYYQHQRHGHQYHGGHKRRYSQSSGGNHKRRSYSH